MGHAWFETYSALTRLPGAIGVSLATTAEGSRPPEPEPRVGGGDPESVDGNAGEEEEEEAGEMASFGPAPPTTSTRAPRAMPRAR